MRMPAKKKRAPKKDVPVKVVTLEKPASAVVADAFETALAFADFPCELAEAEARNLYAAHGEGFVAWCASKPDAIPVSYLVKVARVECAGGTVKHKRRKSIKDVE